MMRISRISAGILGAAGAIVIAGSAVAIAQGGGPSTVVAPAPEVPGRVAEWAPISALTSGGVNAPGVSSDTIEAARSAFDAADAGDLAFSRVLIAEEHEVIAFWNDGSVCLRVRPVGGGGSAFCSTSVSAHDPATPMYSVPERGDDGVVVALVPDDVTQVVATSTDGQGTPIRIRNNVAIGAAESFGSLAWTVSGTKTYERAAPAR